MQGKHDAWLLSILDVLWGEHHAVFSASPAASAHSSSPVDDASIPVKGFPTRVSLVTVIYWDFWPELSEP
jgi:hypothetical protein